MDEKQKEWDLFFLNLAKEYSVKSKDPSTKVGAVITNNNLFVSAGYNGFGRGVKDSPERLNDRDTKILMTAHGEVNAIIFAKRDLYGCTLFTYPFAPCSSCAAIVINSGIKRVVCPTIPERLVDRWKKSLDLAKTQFEEVGVELVEYDLERGVLA